MKQVIAMHGWSGDSRAWQPWERHFQRHDWAWQSGDRGYGHTPFREPQWTVDREPASAQRRVVIGHSLGPHLIPETVLNDATDLVLLASFSRFIPEGRAGRALQTGLQGMARCIGSPREPAMLESFLTKAATPASATALPPGPIHEGLSAPGRQRLLSDLHRLIASAALPPGIPSDARVLVVNASDDRIVVPEARQQLLDQLRGHLRHQPCVWTLASCGHALLVPDLLVQVQEWLDSAPEHPHGPDLPIHEQQQG